ncbi:hypothetical protein FV297_27815, partial [Escherichia coli]
MSFVLMRRRPPRATRGPDTTRGRAERGTQGNHGGAACPHSAMRAKGVPPEAMENAPASRQAREGKERD